MKIDLQFNGVKTTISTIQEVTLREVYTGIGIETDQGLFSICQRDGGLEVYLGDKMVWSSTFDITKLPAPSKRTEDSNVVG